MSGELISLDDIIKKTKAGTGRARGSKRGGFMNMGRGNSGRNPAGPARNTRPGHANGLLRGGATKVIEDARFKIIQKNRLKLTDARDKLSQIAKQSDARLKLQKIRNSGHKGDMTSISRKTEKNGRVRLSTNRIVMNHAIRSLPFPPPPARPTSYRDSAAMESLGHYEDELLDYSDGYINSQPSLRRTVRNDYTPPMPPPPPIFNLKSLYHDWDKPTPVSRATALRSLDLDRPRTYKVVSHPAMSRPSPSPYKEVYSFASKTRTIIADDSPDSKLYLGRSQRDPSSRTRLESPPKSSRVPSSSSRSKPVVPTTGYRIIVSNLQANVTNEDIKELFEDVGELVSSKLAVPGTAEVVYKTLKDATKAVETYHNRQLDGHPMKCLLLSNSRPKMSVNSSSRSSTLQSRSSSYLHGSLRTVHRGLHD